MIFFKLFYFLTRIIPGFEVRLLIYCDSGKRKVSTSTEYLYCFRRFTN